MATETFNATDTWEAPTGVTEVQAECWGPGGNGGARTDSVADNPETKENEAVAAVSGGGGGGGAYALKVITVTPGNVYTVNVGTVGSSDTWFVDATTVLAKRGQAGSVGVGGLGGTALDSIGDTKTAGANGTVSVGGTAGNGGAGGAANTNGTAPGGGGGGDAEQAGAGPGTGAAGRVVLTWEDPPPPEPDPTASRNQLIIIGY